jgi:long-chain acyl-CoA synthetase
MFARDLFMEQLTAHACLVPERVALESEAGSLSYAELVQAVSTLKSRFQAAGVTVVALAALPPDQWLCHDLALLAADCVCVPVPGFFSTSQVQHLLQQTGAQLIVGQTQLTDAVLAELGFAHNDLGWQRQVQPRPLPAGTVKITFTSGTTGQPKGVCLSSQALLTVVNSLEQATAFMPVNTHLSLMPMAVLLENLGVWAALQRGATIKFAAVNVLSGTREDVQRFVVAVATSEAGSMILVPQLLDVLLAATAYGFTMPASFSFIAVGGGRVPPSSLVRASDLGWPVFEGYGLSECASVVCLNTLHEQRAGTVGKPLPHVHVTLAEDGEILVSGAGVLGYLDAPHKPEQPWPTGDIGHFEDGFLVIHGRKKNQFITAYGRNVNPEWVESELCSSGRIRQALVWGEGLPINMAVLTPANDSVTDQQLQQAVDQVNQGLPDYARVGHWCRTREPLTAANGLLTSNGRLRRDDIIATYADFFKNPQVFNHPLVSMECV